MEHEFEKDRLKFQGSANYSNGAKEPNTESSIEKLIKSIKTMSIKVPKVTERYNLLFNSLERAFKTKNVPGNQQAGILLHMLRDKSDNLLIYTTKEQIESYEELKEIDSKGTRTDTKRHVWKILPFKKNPK